MKTKLKLLITALCGLFVTTAAFGTTYIWTGGGDGVDIDAAANWGGTVPTSSAGDIGEWNGVAGGNLFLTHNSSGSLNSGTPGISFYLTANQTGSVNISSRVAASANIALNATTIDSGAGAFSLGNGSANVLNIIERPSSSGSPFPIHTNLNNSANAATINPNVRYQSGGGNPHTLQFDGTGDWIVNNALNCANAGNNNNFIIKMGSGTMFWNANSIAAAAGLNGIGSPIDIEGGRVVLTASTTELGTQAIINNATLQFDAPAAAQTLSGTMSGIGNVVVSAGTLTLSSSQSAWTGNVVLTNGGVLVVGGAQNAGGTGPLGTDAPTNTISFNSGTLQFSVANTFDYSPRFSTAANQAFSFNTSGQSVTFTNALTSSGGTLTKLGSGTLTLTGANTYSGTTAVGAGKLILQSTAGIGAIIVSNSTVLGVNQGGIQIAPSSLTVGTSSSATLEFNNVTSTTTAAIAAAGAVSAGGPITVNVNGGSFTIGQSYPLFSWGSGNPPPVVLGTVVGALGNLSTNGSKIQLNVTGLSYVWSGLNNNNWDTSTPNNWKVNGVAQTWTDGSAALFDDTVTTANTNITLTSVVSPASTTVNSSVTPYFIASSGGFLIGGTGSFTKSGNAEITVIGGINTYTGPTIINGGILSVGGIDNGTAASDIGSSSSAAANLVLNGGTLRHFGITGSGTSDRLFTLGTAGGTIDNEAGAALTLNNPGAVALSGSGARTLVLADGLLVGSTPAVDTLAAVLGDNGGATSLGKNGPGEWVLTGNNTNSGTVTIAAGTLQVGNGGASGSVGSGNIVNNGSLMFNRTGTLTNGTVTGTGSVTVDGGGTVILAGNNTYSGVTTINVGTLQIGIGGASGSMNNSASIVDNDTLIYNSTSTLTLNPAITGSGNVIVRKGTLQAIGNNTYTGWTQIDPGATFQPCLGNVGTFTSSVVTNNGTITFGRQDFAVFTNSAPITGSGSLRSEANNPNAGDVTLTGSNSYTGGTFIGDNQIILGDNSTPGSGAIVGDVQFVNNFITVDDNPRTITFNRVDDFTFNGNITTNFTSPQNNLGIVQLNGSATVTLTGTNTYGSGTVINAGALQVGNGGTTGSIGFGPVTDNSVLIFNRSDSLTFGGAISGSSTATLAQSGSGTVTLTGDGSAFTGNLMVSNGTMVVNGNNAAANVEVFAGATLGGSGVLINSIDYVQVDAGGTLAPGASSTSIGTLTAPAIGLYGNIVIKLNKSLAQSNDVVNAALGNSGTGTLIVTNLGPDLKVGDKFTVLSQTSSYGGSSLTIIGANASWQNNLDSDGSITVLTVTNTGPGTFTNKPGIQTFSLNQANIVISGTNGQAGDAYYLLASTNVALPLSQWTTVATNVLSANGSFTFIGTNVVVPNSLHQFYILSNTNH